VAASQLSDPLGVVLLAAAREAFVQGLHLIGIVSAVVMTGMAVVVVLGRGAAGAHPEALPADESTDEATAVGRVACQSPGLGRSEGCRCGDGEGGKAMDPILPFPGQDINETGGD
jgi:hypothetical protein